MKTFIYFFLFLIVMNSCGQNSEEYTLSGKIIIREIPSGFGKNYIYSNNVRTKFKLPNSSEKKYSGLRWLNKEDYLVAVESIKSKNGKSTHSNLVLIDTMGNVVKEIINSKEGQYVGRAYMSPSDSLLFFTTEIESEHLGALSVFKRSITINVINFSNLTLIKQMSGFCSSNNFDIRESPWSPNDKSFVYSINNDMEIREEGKTMAINLHLNEGVYIYNLKEDTHNRIADKGYFAIWSPQGESIAFINDNKIWLHNILLGKNELLYEAERFEQIKIIHWTPDGHYLYVVCPKYYGSNFNMKHNEKLIEIKGKKEVDFVKPNICFNHFTWKGSF